MVLATIVLFTSCEREGWDAKEIGLDRVFKPVNDVRSTGNYGNALLQWQLPDSTSTLNIIKVQWSDKGEQQEAIYSNNMDSVWINVSEENDYTFSVVSLGIDGEEQIIELEPCYVQSWDKEPTAVIENLKTEIVVNSLLASWTNPKHPTYVGVEFKILLEDSVSVAVDTFVSADNPSDFELALDYETSYICSYYSINTVDSVGEIRSFRFMTGAETPEVPQISIDSTSFYTDRSLEFENLGKDPDTTSIYDFCHSAEIKWTPTEKMDSIRISFVNMHGGESVYIYGGEKGFLSLLPGGTVEIYVQAKEAGGVWSLSESQKIKTQLKEESTTLDYESKLGKAQGNLSLAIAIALVPKPVKEGIFQFSQLASFTDITLIKLIRDLKELELCVNIENITFGKNNFNPKDKEITFNDYKRMLKRLPRLKSITIATGCKWPHLDELEAEVIANYPHIIFTK